MGNKRRMRSVFSISRGLLSNIISTANQSFKCIVCDTKQKYSSSSVFYSRQTSRQTSLGPVIVSLFAGSSTNESSV